MKKILVWLLVLVLCISIITLFGCEQEEVPDEEEVAAEEEAPAEEEVAAEEEAPAEEEVVEEVELRMWTYPGLEGIHQELIDEFKSLNPNVKSFSLEVIGWEQIYDKLNMGISTGTSPDIQFGSYFWFGSPATQDVFLSLDDIIDTDDFAPALLKLASAGTYTYMFPQLADAIGLAVNRTMFEEAGVGDMIPQNIDTPWTFDEFFDACVAVSDQDNGIYGYALGALNEQGDAAHWVMLWNHGARSWSDDGEFIINSPEAVKGLEFYLKMIEAKIVPANPAARSDNDNFTDFGLGKEGFIYGIPGDMKGFQLAFEEGSAEEFDLDLIQYPTDGNRDTGSAIYLSGYVAYDTGDVVRQKWAKKFIEFAASKESSKKFHEAAGGVPARISGVDNVEEGSLEYKSAKLVQYAQNLGAGSGIYSDLRALFYPTLQAVFIGAKTPQEALDDFTAEINALLGK